MFYEITDRKLRQKVEAWYEKRHETEKAFLRLSRRVGASRTRFASTDTFGYRSFAFVFTSEPDRRHWKKDHSGQFWLPKWSSKIGRTIAEEIGGIEKSAGMRCELSKLFGVTDFLKSVGIEKIGNKLIVVFDDGWKFSTNGLRRISDVDVEALRFEQGVTS